MKRFSFEPGVHLRINGVRFLIVSPLAEGEGFTLLDQAVGVARDWTIEELHDRLARGTLEYDPPAHLAADGKLRSPKPSEPVASMSAPVRARVDFRLKVIQAVEAIEPRRLFAVEKRLDPKTGTVTEAPLIVHAITEACRAEGKRPVSVATYYNWRKEYARHGDVSELRGNFEKRGRKPYLDPVTLQKLKEALAASVELAKARATVGVLTRLTPGKVRKELKDVLPEEKLPSLTTVARAIEAMPAYDRAVVRYGAKKADNVFRMASAIERPAVCCDRVEYDETRLRVLVTDELFGGLPLGIPYLSWYVDAVSYVPLGFYVGFEPMSDVSTTAALRHACLPKTYVRSEYPSIKGELLASVPRGIVFDNGLSQHGNTIEEMSKDVGFDYQYAPPYCPWFKGAVENMHNTLNDLLLSDLPGFVVEPSLRPDDYDPKVNACIGLRHFLFLLHKWLADRYMLTPTGAFALRPIDRWRAGTERVKPTFLASARDLDLVFGVLRTGTLDHRGIRYENLRYLGDDMKAFRHLHGRSVEIDVRVNPANLGAIYWRGPDQLWRRAEAKDRDYAAGRGLYHHRLILRAAANRFGSDEIEALSAADRELRALGRAGLQTQMGLRQKGHIARALGIGSDSLLGDQRHDGSLGPATGMYAGLPMNPFGTSESTPPKAPALPAPEVPTESPAIDRAVRRQRPKFHVQRFGEEAD